MKRIDSKFPKYTYDDLVADVVKAGVAQKRAYMFLAGLGIKGELARWEEQPGYFGFAQKAPVNDRGEVLLSPEAIFRTIDMTLLGYPNLKDQLR